MIPLKKLVGQTAIYGLSSIIGRLLNWLLVPLYTHLFLPEHYGVITDIYAYISFLMIILTYGMETGFFRFSKNDNDIGKVYSTSVSILAVTSLVFIVLLYIFANPIAAILKYRDHPEYVIWMGMILGLDAFTAIPFAKLRRQNRPAAFVTIKLVNIGVNIAANLFFLVLCPKLIAGGGGNSFIQYIYNPDIGVGYVFISNLLASAVTMIALLPAICSDVRTKDIDIPLLKEMLRYSLPLLAAGLAGMVNETLDRILLKYLIPIEENPLAQVGIYGANYKLSIMMTIFIQTFRYAAEPFFFSHADKKDAKAMYAEVMKYFIIAGLFIFLGVMLYIDIAKYFIGENFHSGLKIVPILLLANLFLGVIFNLSIWFKLTNMTSYGMLLALFGAIITIIANYILIPMIGYMGSAWATFICYALMMIVSYLCGNKYYPVEYDLKRISQYFFLALSLYFISTFIHGSTAFRLSVNSVLLAVFVVTVFYREWIKR